MGINCAMLRARTWRRMFCHLFVFLSFVCLPLCKVLVQITLDGNLSCHAQSQDVLKDVTKMPICLRYFHPFRFLFLDFCNIWDNSYLSLKAKSTEHQCKFKVLPTNLIFHSIWVFEHCSAVGSVFLWPIKSAMNMLGARTKALMTWGPQKPVPY